MARKLKNTRMSDRFESLSDLELCCQLLWKPCDSPIFAGAGKEVTHARDFSHGRSGPKSRRNVARIALNRIRATSIFTGFRNRLVARTYLTPLFGPRAERALHSFSRTSRCSPDQSPPRRSSSCQEERTGTQNRHSSPSTLYTPRPL